MPLRSPKMYFFIFGFHRLVWWPKCTPASSRSLMVTVDTFRSFQWSLGLRRHPCCPGTPGACGTAGRAGGTRRNAGRGVWDVMRACYNTRPGDPQPGPVGHCGLRPSGCGTTKLELRVNRARSIRDSALRNPTSAIESTAVGRVFLDVLLGEVARPRGGLEPPHAQVQLQDDLGLAQALVGLLLGQGAETQAGPGHRHAAHEQRHLLRHHLDAGTARGGAGAAP